MLLENMAQICCVLHESGGHNFLVHTGGRFTTQLLPPWRSVDWEGWIVFPAHRASGWGTTDADSWTDSQHMSLSLFSSDNGVEGTGVLCVEGRPNSLWLQKREEPPFSRRAQRAISQCLILTWRVDGRTEPTKPQRSFLNAILGCLFFNYCSMTSH